MTPSDATAGPATGFGRNGILWFLAAVLGAATVHAGASVIHDTAQRRLAARLVAHTMAEQLVTRATQRLEAAAMPAFAPATPLTAPYVRQGRGAAVVNALALEQRDATRCRCRPVLPARAFFRWDGDIAISAVGDSTAPLPPRLMSALTAISRAEEEVADAGGMLPAHLWVDASLGDDAVITAVPRDADGHATSVVGLIADRRSVIASLFALPGPGATAIASDSAPELAWLDSLSVEVRRQDGLSLYGQLDSSRTLRASVQARGALEGLAVTVALASYQIAGPVIAPVASGPLWHIAALLLATVVMIGIAVRSSHREALLARARADFIAGVSHELRMPLAQILLASETLTMHRERDERDRLSLASSILREARRLIALVENVLLFSRTGATELRPRLVPVAVDALLEDVVESVQLAAEDARQSIDADVAPMVGVLGDRTLLRQALVNLVDNAMKYGGPGQRIRVVVEHPSSSRVRLIVEDEGRGVPYAERVRVFEPYERLARDQSSERTGTGLGLAVVRQIVTACQGRVWLEQTAAGGTRAVIELAAAALPQPAPPPSAVA